MRYQIWCIRAASGETVVYSHKLAFVQAKKLLAKANPTTGATVGLPHYAAMGAVSVKGRTGLSIGFRQQVVSASTSTRIGYP